MPEKPEKRSVVDIQNIIGAIEARESSVLDSVKHYRHQRSQSKVASYTVKILQAPDKPETCSLKAIQNNNIAREAREK